MTEPLDAIAIAAEVIAWLTLTVGVVLLAIGLVRRSLSHRFAPTKAVVVAVEYGDATVRWFGNGGHVHEITGLLGGATPTVGDARIVWVDPVRPDSAKLDDPAHSGRVALILGIIMTSVGAIATVLSFVLPLL